MFTSFNVSEVVAENKVNLEFKNVNIKGTNHGTLGTHLWLPSGSCRDRPMILCQLIIEGCGWRVWFRTLFG